MTYANVEIDLSEIDTEDLIEELRDRSWEENCINNFSDIELVTQIYQLRRTGQDYQKELDELIYKTLGRIL